MATTGHATVLGIPAVPAIPNPSIATSFKVQAQIQGGDNPSNFGVVGGLSASRPATMGGVTGSTGVFGVPDATNIAFRSDTANPYSIDALFYFNNIGAGSPGDHWWLMYFKNSAPSSGTVPDAVMGPFTVVA